MAVLLAANDIRPTGRHVFIAELGLDGRLRPVRGILPAVMAAVQAGYPDVVVAQANAAEAGLVPGAQVRGYRTLARLAFDFGRRPQDLALDFEPMNEEPDGSERDLGGTSGAGHVRTSRARGRAAGHWKWRPPEHHHVLLTGPPGAGKNDARGASAGLLPDLGDREAMEVTAIHSLSSLTSASVTLLRRPPYENPHHTRYRSRHHRRRLGTAPAGRGFQGAPWRTLPRRSPRVRATGPRRAPAAAGKR